MEQWQFFQAWLDANIRCWRFKLIEVYNRINGASVVIELFITMELGWWTRRNLYLSKTEVHLLFLGICVIRTGGATVNQAPGGGRMYTPVNE